ncbi:MAG: GNAT family N-acetyltransferase [Saprospiraceae bacterium]|nr:GNAT family N-acetyltransferase [Saprospiraceae bacterium]MBK6564343.1 GNAT family N-acetyltransferase [Saprospiraceae bacterium]MBK6782511.1 GNAT family N-acetyltransferase [Saprospiraceae bacterium]MBK7523975.1 GNAT family N-acetyltransferase [Saprospiraceae bacterium]MBK8079057.1 GNAT family N-acetyltransferase [Saprospiraceae bacterium]
MKIEVKTFNQLTNKELYKVLDLRNKVFIVEQNCVYLDTDNKDYKSHHFMIWDKDQKLMGYSRILPPGIAYSDYCSIGRVITSKENRGSGLGQKLMKMVVEQTKLLYPDTFIKIEAQSYLINFYKSFGFEPIGDDYMLDGILHREMILA